ncbi:MAG: hypothetical protein PHN82_05395 [bacterium]|nr:hypothetical protein [bacterium]
MHAESACACFRRDRTGWVLVALNLLMAANSTLYFTGMLGAGVDGWLAMNSCAPSIFVFCLGYLLRQRPLMAVGAGLMFRYGTLGLTTFGWDGMNLIPQAGHILMTLAVIYFVVRMVRLRGWGEIVTALLTVVVMLYTWWQSTWFGRRPEVWKALMDGRLRPELFR